jgi:hypothetical protein
VFIGGCKKFWPAQVLFGCAECQRCGAVGCLRQSATAGASLAATALLLPEHMCKASGRMSSTPAWQQSCHPDSIVLLAGALHVWSKLQAAGAECSSDLRLGWHLCLGSAQWNSGMVREIGVLTKQYGCVHHANRCATWRGLQGGATTLTPGWTSSSQSWCCCSIPVRFFRGLLQPSQQPFSLQKQLLELLHGTVMHKVSLLQQYTHVP